MNRRNKSSAIAVTSFAILLGSIHSANACEPILPLFHALTGATFVTASLWALGAAVFIKCAAVTYYERDLPKPKAFLFMLLANVVSTFYEEWIVYLLARKPKEPPTFYRAVVRANVLTLLIVMGCTAAYQLPQRFASPHFTITTR